LTDFDRRSSAATSMDFPKPKAHMATSHCLRVRFMLVTVIAWSIAVA
jgi:hypothetical protein